MHVILKLIFYGLFVYFMVNGFFRLYRYLNDKILQSQTLQGVIGFALLLIVANLFLFFAGIFLFLKIYEFLSLPT